MQVELVSWNDVYARCRSIAHALREQDIAPDLIIAIARGGFAPARVLCDFLDIHDLASFKVEHYAAGAREKSVARVVFPVNTDIRNRRVLLVDDVNDSGDTLAVARPYLRELEPASLHTAVLDQKQNSPESVDLQGRLVTQWRWLTYPWAVMEDLSAWMRDREPRPASPTEMRQALEQAHGIRPADATLDDVMEYLRWRVA
jgi:hypoxanthine phosphoribosyltransferase